jgi:hypothetical protein
MKGGDVDDVIAKSKKKIKDNHLEQNEINELLFDAIHEADKMARVRVRDLEKRINDDIERIMMPINPIHKQVWQVLTPALRELRERGSSARSPRRPPSSP